ncbi:hypothetical protein BCR34DRAFT_496143, partial [Clohesyomyces aquaticus]
FPSTDDVRKRLQDLDSEISGIPAISGSPGLSLGVLCKGQIVHTAYFGRRNENDTALPTNNTIYWIASLTKVITATAIS